MAGRVLLVLAALVLLYGCGQASSPSEKQEKEAAIKDNGAPPADLQSSDVNVGEPIELRVANPSVGFEYAFDCNTDDAKGYDAPFLKQLTPGSMPIGYSCPTSEEGPRRVGVKIRDKGGDVTEYTDTVTIRQGSPSVDLDDQSADEGRSTSFNLGTFSDAADDGPWEVTVDWGDGSPKTSFQVKKVKTPSAQFITARHTYDDDGEYTVTVKVAESGTTRVASDTLEVIVYSLTPVFRQEVEGTVPQYEVSQEEPETYCLSVSRCFSVETEADDEEALVLIVQDIIENRNLDDEPNAAFTAAGLRFEFQEFEGDQTLITAFAFRDDALAEEVLSEEALRHATVINGVYFVPSEYLEAPPGS